MMVIIGSLLEEGGILEYSYRARTPRGWGNFCTSLEEKEPGKIRGSVAQGTENGRKLKWRQKREPAGTLLILDPR
jgi:hypothetical protein